MSKEPEPPRPAVAGSRKSPTQPGFAGIATFLRAPQVAVEAIPVDAVAVAGIPLDGFADTPGTSDGPRGVREASVAFLESLLPSMRGTLVDVDTERRLEFVADLPLVDTGDVDPLLGSAALRDHLAAYAAAAAHRASLSVFLGRTRAVTAPLLEGVGRATVGAIDLMEVSPALDPSGRTMRYAAELLTHFLAPRIFDVAPVLSATDARKTR